MLEKGAKAKSEDYVSPDEEIKDPFVLEFLNLKDEYSEHDLEAVIIEHLQTFLLEMGAGFAFVGRQKRLCVGDEWYRVDLVLFNRRLKCLVIIDLKLGKLTHAVQIRGQGPQSPVYYGLRRTVRQTAALVFTRSPTLFRRVHR